MKAYIDKTALVAEIERRKSQLQTRITELGNFESNTLGLFQEVDLYDDIISFLDTLEVKEAEEEPVSNDLEEAAHLYVDTTIEYFDSEGNPCCYSAFKAGAQWQKEQMITKACVFLKSMNFYKYYNREFIKEFKKAMRE